MQLEILSCLGYRQRSLNVNGFDALAKINVFNQMALLYNTLVFMSY